jgi:hypothetical protein
MIIHHAFRKRRNTGIATLHCNARTTAEHVIAKIAQTCSLFSSPEGRGMMMMNMMMMMVMVVVVMMMMMMMMMMVVIIVTARTLLVGG